MTALPTNVIIDTPPTPEQLALLNEDAQNQAQRFVQAVTRLAATHLGMAEQIIQNLCLITTNTENFGAEAVAHAFQQCKERGGLDEEPEEPSD